MGWTRVGFYTGLVTAFGLGCGNRLMEIGACGSWAALIVAYASLGFLWPFGLRCTNERCSPLEGRRWSDTATSHSEGFTVFLMLLAIGVGAATFGRRFRLYSIATIVVLLVFGGLTFLEAPRLEANLPTPVDRGLWERINISVFLLGLWCGGRVCGR
jgi:hypothetical protein